MGLANLWIFWKWSLAHWHSYTVTLSQLHSNTGTVTQLHWHSYTVTLAQVHRKVQNAVSSSGGKLESHTSRKTIQKDRVSQFSMPNYIGWCLVSGVLYYNIHLSLGNSMPFVFYVYNIGSQWKDLLRWVRATLLICLRVPSDLIFFSASASLAANSCASESNMQHDVKQTKNWKVCKSVPNCAKIGWNT